MDLLALRDQRIARERIGVLAADQHPELADLGVADREACAVAVRPDQLLVERRNQLAVMVEDRAIRADQQVRVPQAADRSRRALADADRDEDAVLAGGVAKLLHLRARHLDRVGGEPLEIFMVLDRRLHRRPDRKARHERFRECDQPRAGARGLRDQRTPPWRRSSAASRKTGATCAAQTFDFRILDHSATPAESECGGAIARRRMWPVTPAWSRGCAAAACSSRGLPSGCAA